MFPGLGRGINPKKMQQMMKQMGIDVREIDGVEQVIIRTADRDIVFNDAEVTIMDARGVKTYQIVGTPEEKYREMKISQEDINLVVEQAKVSAQEAQAALKESKGDIAEAILKLTEKK